MDLVKIETEIPSCCLEGCELPAVYKNEDFDGPMHEVGNTYCEAHGKEIIKRQQAESDQRMVRSYKQRLEIMHVEYYRLVATVRCFEKDYNPPFTITVG